MSMSMFQHLMAMKQNMGAVGLQTIHQLHLDLHLHRAVRISIPQTVHLLGFTVTYRNLFSTWWFIPLSKWVITPVIITRVVTHLLNGVSHQVDTHVRTCRDDLVSLSITLINPSVESPTMAQWRPRCWRTSRNSSAPSLQSRLGRPSRPGPLGRGCGHGWPGMVLTCWKRTGAKGLSLSYNKGKENSKESVGFWRPGLCCVYILPENLRM